MSASIAIASSAMATSNLAASQAREAKLISCKSLLNTYDAKTATIQEMRVYADCVTTVHPTPMSDGGIVVAKILFVAALIGGVAGVYLFGDNWDRWLERVMNFFCGFVLAPIALCFIGGICIGIAWLFS